MVWSWSWCAGAVHVPPLFTATTTTPAMPPGLQVQLGFAAEALVAASSASSSPTAQQPASELDHLSTATVLDAGAFASELFVDFPRGDASDADVRSDEALGVELPNRSDATTAPASGAAVGHGHGRETNGSTASTSKIFSFGVALSTIQASAKKMVDATVEALPMPRAAETAETMTDATSLMLGNVSLAEFKHIRKLETKAHMETLRDLEPATVRLAVPSVQARP